MTSLLGEQYVTVSQAAAMLEVSQPTVWRWIREGKLAAYRVGQKRVRIKKGDLSALIVPARQGSDKGTTVAQTERGLRGPLTDEEVRRGLEALAHARELGRRLLARGKEGEIRPDSTALIRRAREDRAKQLSRP